MLFHFDLWNLMLWNFIFVGDMMSIHFLFLETRYSSLENKVLEKIVGAGPGLP